MSIWVVALWIIAGSAINRFYGGNPERLTDFILSQKSTLTVLQRKEIFKKTLNIVMNSAILVGVIGVIFSLQSVMLLAIGFLLHFLVFVIPKIDKELVYFDLCHEYMEKAMAELFDKINERIKELNVKE